jgi:hypothetical protein
LTGSSSELRRCLNPLPSSALVETGGISQVPGQPLREHALLFDPGGPHASGPCDAPDVAFPPVDLVGSAFLTFRGSITQPARSLSTLRGSDHSDSTPRKTRYPLAANLGGAGLEPAGLHSKVSLGNVTSHHFDPPSPSFAWRTGGHAAARVGGAPEGRDRRSTASPEVERIDCLSFAPYHRSR